MCASPHMNPQVWLQRIRRLWGTSAPYTHHHYHSKTLQKQMVGNLCQFFYKSTSKLQLRDHIDKRINWLSVWKWLNIFPECPYFVAAREAAPPSPPPGKAYATKVDLTKGLNSGQSVLEKWWQLKLAGWMLLPFMLLTKKGPRWGSCLHTISFHAVIVIHKKISSDLIAFYVQHASEHW